jgi:hypothetical protein
MKQYRREHNIKMLWTLILFGIAYSGILHTQRTLTGLDQVDGAIGVLLGLYICSYPAANLVDILFYRQGARYSFPSRRSAVMWLALNLLVLLIGWVVIFGGTTRFLSKVD